jgi:uncharacterized membrane protein YphA (DoxX/SURF4 family)
MTPPIEWSLAQRIGFRFAFVLGFLIVFPFPIGAFAWTDDIDTVLNKPLTWGTAWLAHLIGAPRPWDGPNGSGDTSYGYVQLLLCVLLAVLAAIVWSVIDRRRGAYPRLAEAGRIVLRYYLVFVMLSYGGSKLFKHQFYDLAPTVLHQRLGETPPQRLLWAFMGYSLPYTVFAGFMETLGGVLLIWRRTTTLGALILIAVLTNVVLMNLCYDVPVKIWSSELLVMAIVIAAPDLRRMLGAVLGRATPEIPPRPRMSTRHERIRRIVKLAVIALFLLREVPRELRRPSHSDHGHELYGTWIVDTFVSDGVEHPPLTTDRERWEAWAVNASYSTIFFMDGKTEKRDPPTRNYYGVKVNAAAHTVTVTVDYAKGTNETWSYSLPAPDQLVIDCVHAGKKLHVAMHREAEGALLTRGFHWINEWPNNL